MDKLGFQCPFQSLSLIPALCDTNLVIVTHTAAVRRDYYLSCAVTSDTVHCRPFNRFQRVLTHTGTLSTLRAQHSGFSRARASIDRPRPFPRPPPHTPAHPRHTPRRFVNDKSNRTICTNVSRIYVLEVFEIGIDKYLVASIYDIFISMGSRDECNMTRHLITLAFLSALYPACREAVRAYLLSYK